ncbi:MAG: hypothetical protein GX804_01860 [Lentisphaerae bacterium]|jgi:cell division protein FtsB|nr:hypothetical protein [Lentisphaerota bacterium]
MQSSFLKPFKYALLVLLGVVAAVLVIRLFAPLVVKRAQLAKERDELKQDNEYFSHEIATLRQKQENFANDPEYTELEARREGFVARTEIVFDFNTTTGSPR